MAAPCQYFMLPLLLTTVPSTRGHALSPWPTLTATPPVACHGSSGSWAANAALTWMRPGMPVLSMREAVLTESPNRQKRGMRRPTTPGVRVRDKHMNHDGLCMCVCVCAPVHVVTCGIMMCVCVCVWGGGGGGGGGGVLRIQAR